MLRTNIVNRGIRCSPHQGTLVEKAFQERGGTVIRLHLRIATCHKQNEVNTRG